MWLSEAAANKAVHAGMLYIQTYVQLAHDCLQKMVPRYKVRPKCHSFHCETVLRIKGGSRANPRFFSCFNDEDFVGRSCSVGKQSVHPVTLAKRVLERLLMHTNTWLAEKSERSMHQICRCCAHVVVVFFFPECSFELQPWHDCKVVPPYSYESWFPPIFMNHGSTLSHINKSPCNPY